MKTITFISTVHRNLGKCNAIELYEILRKIGPDVIFVEALENTYSNYEKQLFSSFEIFHKKLEIEAIQRYGLLKSFNYIPVLDYGLSDVFSEKYTLVCTNPLHQKMNDNFNSLASEQGFQFLNSDESIILQEQMRKFELNLLNDVDLNQDVDKYIESYENSMIQNILTYSKENHYVNAVFLCGVAHRSSIINKIKSLNCKEETNLKWIIYGN